MPRAPTVSYLLRKAKLEDEPVLRGLIARSIRELGTHHYTSQQIEAALRGAFGVDTQLITDGTYFVAELQNKIIGCGGWSRRRTLFGGNTHTQRDVSELNPLKDPAKIRAFFVDPAYARRGIGKAILERCESEVLACGFLRFELMATLPGVNFYKACGYILGTPVDHSLDAGLSIRFVPMTKVA